MKKDKPTKVELDGTKYWEVDGKLHRENGPAVISNYGKMLWYKNGVLYRDDNLPAVEYSNGGKEWYENEKIHREDDLPAIEEGNGTKKWYKNGLLHRDGKPAIIKPKGRWEKCDAESWYQNDKMHREDGPAVIYSDGNKEWWIDGKQLTEKEFGIFQLQKQLNKDLDTSNVQNKKMKL